VRFIVFGDSKGKNLSGINEKVLEKILRQVCKLKPQPEFFVMCGDTVAGSSDKNILLNQLLTLRKLIEKYHPTKLIFPVIGNHEVNGQALDDRYEKVISTFYSNLEPDGYLDGYNKTVYYIDFGNTRFIILNSFHCGEIHRIEGEQLKWLEKTASVDKQNKLVFIHSPAFPTGAHLGHCLDLYPDLRDKFWNVIRKSNVDIVFSGHEHNYSRRRIEQFSNNIDNDCKYVGYQIITGGGGEKLRDKFKSKDGVIVPPVCLHHFVVVDIEANSIKVTAMSSDGKIIDSFKITK
jgi:hypothetical protein